MLDLKTICLNIKNLSFYFISDKVSTLQNSTFLDFDNIFNIIRYTFAYTNLQSLLLFNLCIDLKEILKKK